MSLPLTIPTWIPGWLLLALAVPVLLWFLAFLMVPFNVFGVKARLETMESELEELNEQIRVMQLRAAGTLPTVSPTRNTESSYDDLPNFAQLKRARAEPPAPVEEPPAARRPPIPTPQPRGSFGQRESMVPREHAAPPPRPRRTEPRLD